MIQIWESKGWSSRAYPNKKKIVFVRRLDYVIAVVKVFLCVLHLWTFMLRITYHSILYIFSTYYYLDGDKKKRKGSVAPQLKRHNYGAPRIFMFLRSDLFYFPFLSRSGFFLLVSSCRNPLAFSVSNILVSDQMNLEHKIKNFQVSIYFYTTWSGIFRFVFINKHVILAQQTVVFPNFSV